MTTHLALWRRLDTRGHDACRLTAVADGWRLEGTAVYRLDREPATLQYRVACDGAWHTREGAVHGWVGGREIAVEVERRGEGQWYLNGVTHPGLEGCVDLDFGFTPATNALQLRRVALGVGASADVPVAWLDVPSGALSRLDQHYRCVAEDAYAYSAPRFGYRAVLEVASSGFVRRYPDLWEAEG